MEITELKNKIENKAIDNTFMIWKLSSDNSMIIAKQYYHAIAKYLNLNIKLIDNISEIPDDSFVEDDNLYIIVTDKWEENKTHNNCIVICNNTKLNCIVFPKLEDWQIIDYILAFIDDVDKDFLEALLAKYSGNYYKFLFDIDKIKIFKTGSRKAIIDLLIRDGLFLNTVEYTTFDLSNAIINKDIKKVSLIFKYINNSDINQFALCTTLMNFLRTMIIIKTDNYATYKTCNISEKQFYFYKKNYQGLYTIEQLTYAYQILCTVEKLFKFDGLGTENIIDYIICKLGELLWN